jgi:hypothetical protein
MIKRILGLLLIPLKLFKKRPAGVKKVKKTTLEHTMDILENRGYNLAITVTGDYFDILAAKPGEKLPKAKKKETKKATE